MCIRDRLEPCQKSALWWGHNAMSARLGFHHFLTLIPPETCGLQGVTTFENSSIRYSLKKLWTRYIQPNVEEGKSGVSDLNGIVRNTGFIHTLLSRYEMSFCLQFELSIFYLICEPYIYTYQPCDLYNDTGYIWNYEGFPTNGALAKKDLVPAPRFDLIQYIKWPICVLRGISLDQRLGEYRALYGKEPDKSWWGWNFFPQNNNMSFIAVSYTHLTLPTILLV